MCKMETWLLEDYVEGLLGDAEVAILEAHLSTCEVCRRELSHIKLLFWEMESMRRETVPLPEALKEVEKAVLDEWLTGRETWLQQTAYQLTAVARQVSSSIPGIPRIPGAGRVTAFAGEMGKKSVKWFGKKTFRLMMKQFRLAGGGE